MSDKTPTLSQQPLPQSPVTIEERLRKARQQFEVKFRKFHELLKIKNLDKNKSQAQLKQEKFVIDELVKACIILESLNIGEGVLALSTVALREHLKVRDRVNEMEYKLESFMKEVTRLFGELESRK